VTREASPLLDQMVFLVGARRSGTVWLQSALAVHPEVMAVPTETYLFTNGVEPLAKLFQHSSPSSIAVGSTYMERDEFLAAVRAFCDRVFLSLRAQLQPAARLIVERTPWHSRVLPLIGSVYPDARVIHIIRDGRDVARSLLRRDWGPDTMAEAAEEWRSSVELARTASAELAHYRECRYEDLVADPVPGVEALLEWLGLTVDDETREQLSLQLHTPVNLLPGEQPGAGKWRDDLSPEDLATFNDIAGGLMAELGYSRDVPEPARPAPDRPSPARRPLGTRLRSVLGRDGHAGQEPQANQRVFDRLLACGDDLAGLFEPAAQISVVGGSEEWRARGPKAVERLRDHLRASAGGRLVRCDVHPVGLTVTGVLVREPAPGRRSTTVLVAELRRGIITRLTCYSL
jgi:sulfotransferase family protein